MSQRKTLKKGARPEITIVSAQPISSSGAQDITYFNQDSHSPKVQSIHHNQSLVLGVDLPHPPRSAPPPRPAEPIREKAVRPDLLSKHTPSRPSPPCPDSGSPHLGSHHSDSPHSHPSKHTPARPSPPCPDSGSPHLGSHHSDSAHSHPSKHTPARPSPPCPDSGSPHLGSHHSDSAHSHPSKHTPARPSPPCPDSGSPHLGSYHSNSPHSGSPLSGSPDSGRLHSDKPHLQGRIGASRPAPPKPVGPKRAHSLGKASDVHAINKRTAYSQTTENIADIGTNASKKKGMPPAKPPRPKSEIVHNSWSVAVPIGDADILEVPPMGTSDVGTADTNPTIRDFHSTEELQPIPVNGTVNGFEETTPRSDEDEKEIDEEALAHRQQVKKPKRPTIITAAAKPQLKHQIAMEVHAEEDCHNTSVTEAAVNENEADLVEPVGTATTVEVNKSSEGRTTTEQDEDDVTLSGQKEAAPSDAIQKPVKPQLPPKVPPPVKPKPSVPVKPNIAAKATTREPMSSSATAHHVALENIESPSSVPIDQPGSAKTPPIRPRKGPPTHKSGGMKIEAPVSNSPSEPVPQTQLPYSSHPERGLRNRPTAVPKVPVKPRRTKSLHRRPSISPPSTPPPPPREEVELLLAGTVSSSSFQPLQKDGDKNSVTRPQRPIPPQRVSSIDSCDKTTPTAQRAPLHSAATLNGIKEHDHEGVRHIPVRPAPPKPVRSHTISAPFCAKEKEDVVNRSAEEVDASNMGGIAKVGKKSLTETEEQEGHSKKTYSNSPTTPQSNTAHQGEDWIADAKFTGPLLSPSTHKEVIWAEDIITESGRTLGSPKLPAGGRVVTSVQFSEENEMGITPQKLMSAGRSPIRPAPPKPSFPPNQAIASESRNPVSIGESSSEKRTDIGTRAHESRRGSLRSPLRPAPPRPTNVTRHKSVSEADYLNKRGLTKVKSRDSCETEVMLTRSRSVTAPSRPAPPPVRKEPRFEKSSASLEETPIKVPPTRPAALPLKVTHDVAPSFYAEESGKSEDMDNARKSTGSSGLMGKIHKNMEVTGPHAIALFNYQTGDDGDLNFQAGDVIILKEKVNKEWIRGSINDQTGIFPSNFVEIIIDIDEEEATKEEETTEKMMTVDGFDISRPHAVALQSYLACKEGELSFDAGDTIELLRKEEDFLVGTVHGITGSFPASFVAVLKPVEIINTAPSTNSENISKTSETGPCCKATFAFSGENPEDLSFEEGDTIKLLERINDEWYKGELNGKTGIFPSAFVTITVELPTAPKSEPSLDVNTENHIDSDNSLKPHAKGLFDFQAMDEGELSFKAGDMITLTRRLEDDWYEGELNGKLGNFPAGFVEVLMPLPVD